MQPTGARRSRQPERPKVNGGGSTAFNLPRVNHAGKIQLQAKSGGKVRKKWTVPVKLALLTHASYRTGAPGLTHRLFCVSCSQGRPTTAARAWHAARMDADRDLALRLHKEMNELPKRGSRRRAEEPTTAAPVSQPKKIRRQKTGGADLAHSETILTNLATLVSDLDSYDGTASEDETELPQDVAESAPLVDAANRPVVAFTWPGTDTDFPCLPKTAGQQQLMWEAELVGTYLMLPCATFPYAANCA